MRNDARSPKGFFIDRASLPAGFPTHRHDPVFWESLGRAVATFGSLEETLAKAIFALTGSRTAPTDEAKIEIELEEWTKKLEKAVTDTLNPLIDSLGNAIRSHPESPLEPARLDQLLADLRGAAVVRNVICHGSWRAPNSAGASVPFYVDRRLKVFASEVDVSWLVQLQRHTAELICDVRDTVTLMGYQFPGTTGPGRPLRTS